MDHFPLDVISYMVLEHLPRSHWVDCMLVSKRWYRALRVTAIVRMINDASGDRRNPANLVVNSALKGQLIENERTLESIQKGALLRQFKLIARTWLVQMAQISGDAEKKLALRFVGTKSNQINPIDFANALQRVTVLELVAECENASDIFAEMLKIAMAQKRAPSDLPSLCFGRAVAANRIDIVNILLGTEFRLLALWADHQEVGEYYPCIPPHGERWKEMQCTALGKLNPLPRVLRQKTSHPLVWAQYNKNRKLIEIIRQRAIEEKIIIPSDVSQISQI